MTAPATTRARRPQWLRVTGWLLGSYLVMMAWLWGTVVVAAILIMAVVSRFHDVEISALQFAQHGVIWFPFSLAIIITSTYLAVHVAAGMTRRSFTIASLVAAVVVGVGNAVANVVVLLLERVVYRSLGWFHGVVDSDGTQEVLSGGVPSYAAGLIGLLTAAMVSGTLVGLVYYRYGGWVGTLTLPLTLSPLVLSGLFPLQPGRTWSPWYVSEWSVGAVGQAVALLVIVAAAAAVVLIARRIPIAPKEA